MASLIEAKNSTNSRENSSHPTPGAGVRGVSWSVNVSGRLLIQTTFPVPLPDTQTYGPGTRRLGEGPLYAGRQSLNPDTYGVLAADSGGISSEATHLTSARKGLSSKGVIGQEPAPYVRSDRQTQATIAMIWLDFHIEASFSYRALPY